MDIYNHLIENIQNENKTQKEQKQIPDKRFFVPQDLKDIQKQKYYKEKQNKNSKKVVEYEQSHVIFQRPWKDLNKPQRMNRLIAYAKQNNLDKKPLLVALEKHKLQEVNYDEKQGCIITIALKE